VVIRSLYLVCVCPIRSLCVSGELDRVWGGGGSLLRRCCSVAYGPEAALTLLIPLGMAGIAHILPTSISIVVLFGIATPEWVSSLPLAFSVFRFGSLGGQPTVRYLRN
jgi:hypothetical protein